MIRWDDLTPDEQAALMALASSPRRPVRKAMADRLCDLDLARRTRSGLHLTAEGWEVVREA